MKYILVFWAVPMSLFWGWFGLSYYDINFGVLMFSRLFHDFAFEFYGGLIGIEPATIPALVARACVVDTAIIFSIFAFRRRADIREWYARTFRTDPAASAATGPIHPAE